MSSKRIPERLMRGSLEYAKTLGMGSMEPKRVSLWNRIRWTIERNIREYAYPFACYAVGIAALRYVGLI